MWIIPKDNTSPAHVADLVRRAIEGSRFRADVELDALRRVPGVKISCIRLRRRKDYCGAHPGPCLVGFRRHMTSTYLEGLDWVGWNALLNDTLDVVKANCHVFSFNREAVISGPYYIRHGRLRRVWYPYAYRDRFAHWTQTKDDLVDPNCFADHCGKKPPSLERILLNLDGTPGYPCYTLTEEDKHRAQEEPEEPRRVRFRVVQRPDAEVGVG